MLGAIAGDIIGSIYEATPIKSKGFPLFGPGVTFTDDTVCTVAIADALLSGGEAADYLRTYVRRYPGRATAACLSAGRTRPTCPRTAAGATVRRCG